MLYIMGILLNLWYILHLIYYLFIVPDTLPGAGVIARNKIQRFLITGCDLPVGERDILNGGGG